MGRFIMGLRDQKTLLIHFELESDVLMALSRDSLTIKDWAFKVYRWKHISYGSYDARISPVWIALPRLPERYWFPEFLLAIGNSVGKFIHVDLPTVTLARPSVARICVEVDLSTDLPAEIGIKYKGLLWQEIVYQNMNPFCCNCRMQGHSTRACRRGNTRPQTTSKIPSMPSKPTNRNTHPNSTNSAPNSQPNNPTHNSSNATKTNNTGPRPPSELPQTFIPPWPPKPTTPTPKVTKPSLIIPPWNPNGTKTNTAPSRDNPPIVTIPRPTSSPNLSQQIPPIILTPNSSSNSKRSNPKSKQTPTNKSQSQKPNTATSNSFEVLTELNGANGEGLIIGDSLTESAFKAMVDAVRDHEANANAEEATIDDSVNTEFYEAADNLISRRAAGPFSKAQKEMVGTQLNLMRDAQSGSPLVTPSDDTIVEDSFAGNGFNEMEELVGSPHSVEGEPQELEPNNHYFSDSDKRGLRTKSGGAS